MPSAVSDGGFFDGLYLGGNSGDGEDVDSVFDGDGSVSSGESVFTTQSVQSLAVDGISDDLAPSLGDDRPLFVETASTQNECSLDENPADLTSPGDGQDGEDRAPLRSPGDSGRVTSATNGLSMLENPLGAGGFNPNQPDSNENPPPLPPVIDARQPSAHQDLPQEPVVVARGAATQSTAGGNDGDVKIPKGRSIAHEKFEANKVVFISLDIETGGEYKQVRRGWFREAVLERLTAAGKRWYIQCTTWRDKKQVCFLSSNRVQASGVTQLVRRRSKGGVENMIPAPVAQRDYAKYFHAVDRNDRDSADYSTTIRTNRYYLRIFCWILDRVVHVCYVVVCCLAKMGVCEKSEAWNRYRSTNGGRQAFQIHLGLSLMNYGIDYDWAQNNYEARPDWIRQKAFVPCDCNLCYFCLNGHTSGISHRKTDHKVTFQFANGVRFRTKGCTDYRVQVRKSGRYCGMCLRLEPKVDKHGNNVGIEQRKRNCKKAYLGCKTCDEPICDRCWDAGYDKHQQKPPARKRSS